jgi:hypothetical protein
VIGNQPTGQPHGSCESGGLSSTHIRGTHMPVEEPSTASGADITAGGERAPHAIGLDQVLRRCGNQRVLEFDSPNSRGEPIRHSHPRLRRRHCHKMGRRAKKLS